MSIFRKRAVGGWCAALSLAIGPAGRADEVAATSAAAEVSAISRSWASENASLVDYRESAPSPYALCSQGGGSSLMEEMEAAMKRMADSGVVYHIITPQFYQGVADGGRDRGFEYGGKVDQYLVIDGGKLLGVEGFGVTTHVETRYGQDVNAEAVGMAPVNVAMLYPNAGEHDTAITGLTLTQYLSEDWQVSAGKVNALDMFYALYPQTGRGVNGFMNASAIIPLGVGRVVPLSFMGAGITKFVDGRPTFAVMAFDNQDVTTTSGFDDMFDNGANIMATYRYYTMFGGLPGSHMAGGIWATGEYVSYDPLSFVIIPGQGVGAVKQHGAYSLIYIGEQTLWTDGAKDGRNVGFLTQWCLAEEETSPFAWTCNAAIQTKGLSRSRPNDAIGVGYFHTGLSNDFVNSLSPVFDLRDVDGVEIYYNMSLAPCFNVTTDLQVIEPAETQYDTAVVAGLRAVLQL
ncbi:carbohydrate porin [Lacipirellula sp.]|uniref:carbohydrate porin n=1 Tax=Lacipirellula sp. TaxID=2691419 RepID=UPI003D132DE4